MIAYFFFISADVSTYIIIMLFLFHIMQKHLLGVVDPYAERFPIQMNWLFCDLTHCESCLWYFSLPSSGKPHEKCPEIIDNTCEWNDMAKVWNHVFLIVNVSTKIARVYSNYTSVLPKDSGRVLDFDPFLSLLLHETTSLNHGLPGD